MKVKNSMRINGTSFCISAAKAMSKEEFISMLIPETQVIPHEDVEKRKKLLGIAHAILNKQ